MFRVKKVSGSKDKMISHLTLEQLRKLMDWQLRKLGYDPQSVHDACRKAEGK